MTKIVKIVWIDASSCETKPPGITKCESVGFLYEDTDEQITIFDTIFDVDQKKRFLSIPKVCIVSMTELSGSGTFQN